MLDGLLLGIALVLLAAILLPRVGATIEQLFEDLW